MMDLKNLNRAVEAIAEEKGVDPAMVYEAVESAIGAAYRKEYGKRGEVIKVNLNPKTGDLSFSQLKTVVDASSVRIKEEETEEEAAEPKVQIEESVEGALPVYNPDRHIFLEEARKINPEISIGDEMEFTLPTQTEFGRIASQVAKQVILQRIRDIERETVRREFEGKEGEVISGIIQRMERGNVFIDLGKALGIMFRSESIPGEYYRIGERLRFYLLAVQEDSRMPGVILSRSHPMFVAKLFELEVPEIHEKVVEIKAVTREAGSRTKIAVFSNEQGVDPIGSLVGQRGMRVAAVTNELGNEKIDIVEWSEDPAKFIASALSPAKVVSVEISPRREAKVFVPEDQLSLAIGRGGQNVRLAAKLTGWKIDVRSESRPDIVQYDDVAEGIDDFGEEEKKAAMKKASEEASEPAKTESAE